MSALYIGKDDTEETETVVVGTVCEMCVLAGTRGDTWMVPRSAQWRISQIVPWKVTMADRA